MCKKVYKEKKFKVLISSFKIPVLVTPNEVDRESVQK